MSEEAKNETPFYDPDPITMPVLALRGLVVYPKMMVHFDVGREASVKAVEEAMSTNSPVFLVAQKDIRVEEPEKKDLFSAGTIAQVRQILIWRARSSPWRRRRSTSRESPTPCGPRR